METLAKGEIEKTWFLVRPRLSRARTREKSLSSKSEMYQLLLARKLTDQRISTNWLTMKLTRHSVSQSIRGKKTIHKCRRIWRSHFMATATINSTRHLIWEATWLLKRDLSFHKKRVNMLREAYLITLIKLIEQLFKDSINLQI